MSQSKSGRQDSQFQLMRRKKRFFFQGEDVNVLRGTIDLYLREVAQDASQLSRPEILTLSILSQLVRPRRENWNDALSKTKRLNGEINSFTLEFHKANPEAATNILRNLHFCILLMEMGESFMKQFLDEPFKSESVFWTRGDDELWTPFEHIYNNLVDAVPYAVHCFSIYGREEAVKGLHEFIGENTFQIVQDRYDQEGVVNERPNLMNSKESKLERAKLSPIFEGELNREALAKALNAVMAKDKLSEQKVADRTGFRKNDVNRARNGKASIEKTADILSALGHTPTLTIPM